MMEATSQEIKILVVQKRLRKISAVVSVREGNKLGLRDYD